MTPGRAVGAASYTGRCQTLVQLVLEPGACGFCSLGWGAGPFRAESFLPGGNVVGERLWSCERLRTEEGVGRVQLGVEPGSPGPEVLGSPGPLSLCNRGSPGP